jgi:hypothetical protein
MTMKDPVSTEQPMTLANVAKGAAMRFFEEAVADLYEEFSDEDTVGHKASITLKIDMTRMGEGSNTFFFGVSRPTVKFPARKGAGNIARYESGVPVVDVLEEQDGNRALPFSITLGTKSE